MIINSIDLQKLRNMAEANERVQMTEYLLSEIQKLARAGAEFGLLAANTPHMVFDEVRGQSPIPLISIVEATCQAAKAMGLQKLGLLGTRMTMQGRFYPDVFSREGIALAVPDEHDQAYIHHVYFNELVKGMVLPETRQRLLKIVDRLKERGRHPRVDFRRHGAVVNFSRRDGLRYSSSRYDEDSRQGNRGGGIVGINL